PVRRHLWRGGVRLQGARTWGGRSGRRTCDSWKGCAPEASRQGSSSVLSTSYRRSACVSIICNISRCIIGSQRVEFPNNVVAQPLITASGVFSSCAASASASPRDSIEERSNVISSSSIPRPNRCPAPSHIGKQRTRSQRTAASARAISVEDSISGENQARSSSSCTDSGSAARVRSCFRTSKTGCSINSWLLMPSRRTALALKYVTRSREFKSRKPLLMLAATPARTLYSCKSPADKISLSFEYICDGDNALSTAHQPLLLVFVSAPFPAAKSMIQVTSPGC